jgi:hypothetical protein
MDLAYTIGTGPIYREFQIQGLFNSDPFHVSGGELYRGQTALGGVAFGTTPRMAAANGYLAIVNGGGLFVYDGTTLSQVQFFDDGVSRLPAFSSVAVLYDIFIFTVQGSTQFFFSEVGNPTVINAANFSNAQTSPDPIVEVAVLAEELYFFKAARAVEIWDYTGQLTAPFALSQGRTYARGCGAQNSVQLLDNGLFWVGEDATVYRSGSVPTSITTPYIADRLKACGTALSQITALNYNLENHVLYVLNLTPINESYAYDCQTKEWSAWGSQNTIQAEPAAYLAASSCGQGSTIYFGSAQDGRVWTANPSSRFDGDTPIRTVVSGAIWLDGNRMLCANVMLQCSRGVGNPETPNPLILMRYSDDEGDTWSSWLEHSLGSRGRTTYKAVWRGLGTMQSPGRLFEFAITDPVSFRVEKATFNTAYP